MGYRDIAIQTGNTSNSPVKLHAPAPAEDEFFPVHSRVEKSEDSTAEDTDGAQLSVERLSHELSAAIKTKVELLRELTKSNKEAERQRHAHSDQVQKMERETDQLQRDLARMQQDASEKDAAREKVKEECERKLRAQETVLNKYKQRQKELEKSLALKSTSEKTQQLNQQEIERLNVVIAQCKKKHKVPLFTSAYDVQEDQAKFADAEERKAKEVSVLKKQIEEEAKKCRQAEVKCEQMRKKVSTYACLLLQSLIEKRMKWLQCPNDRPAPRRAFLYMLLECTWSVTI
jgi:hypothetical protein